MPPLRVIVVSRGPVGGMGVIAGKPPGRRAPLVTPVAYAIFEDLARALGRAPEPSRRGSARRLRFWRRGTAARS